MTNRVRRLFGVGVVLVAFVGCKARDIHAGGGSENGLLRGDYWYLGFTRATTSTLQPDLRARAGFVTADGKGTLTFGLSLGSPWPTKTRTYLVNTQHQIDNRSREPGAVLPGGELFELADMDRAQGGDVGVHFFGRWGANVDIDDLVDPTNGTGVYHAVLVRFEPLRKLVMGRGTAILKRNTKDTATFRIDYTLSEKTTLVRQGALKVAPDGAVAANDVTFKRGYVGFADPGGDWILWQETDVSRQRIFRLDILVRKGSGLGNASLNGRYNWIGFYQSAAGAVDSRFGRLQFDGQGGFFDLTFRDSFGRAFRGGRGSYRVTADGVVTFLGPTNPVGFITRSSGRRWLVFPNLDERAGPLGFFLALRR